MGCLLVFIIVAACQERGGEGEGDGNVENVPTIAPTSDPLLSAIEIDTTSLATPPKFSLQVWLPPDTILSSVEAERMWQQQLEAFGVSHPDVEIEVKTKHLTEPGGIFSYLRTGRRVAPSILPDVILMPSVLLEGAVDEGLVYPLVEPVTTDSIYPALAEMGRVDGTMVGFPFAIFSMHHVVLACTEPLCDTADLTPSFPSRWDEAIALPEARLSLAQTGYVDLTLQLYLSGLGASLTDETASLTFDERILLKALGRMRAGQIADFIPEETVGVSAEESWRLFTDSESNITFVNAVDLLAQEDLPPTMAFDLLPGLDAPALPLVQGWVWAISTPIAARQSLSAELITHLTNDANLGAWSQTANVLPTTAGAFAFWPDNDYTTFLQTQLPNAIPYPANMTTAISEQIVIAADTMLTTDESPAAATQAIIDVASP